jgi:hypothetical protein
MNNNIFDWIMGTIISVLMIIGITAAINAPKSYGDLGQVAYIEGDAEINNGQNWKPLKLSTGVGENDIIRTGPDCIVEIDWWNRGGKSTLESDGTFIIGDLWEANKNPLPARSGVFANFRKIFKEVNAVTSEEGGIRRSGVFLEDYHDPKKLYWKEGPEVSYEEAAAIYEGLDYPRAAQAFKLFMSQKPRDRRVKYAMFALGHSYVMMNNHLAAKETFELFVAQFNGDPLKRDAESLLTELK